MRPDVDGHPLISGWWWKETRKAALGRHLLAHVPLGSPEGYVFLELALKTDREFLGTGNERVQGQTVFRHDWIHMPESLELGSFPHLALLSSSLAPFSNSQMLSRQPPEAVDLNQAWLWAGALSALW